LAAHGDELLAAAARGGVPLLYEASVLAGVPFLGTFRRRPLARTVTGIQGILNGTSNFILSRMARGGGDFSVALKDAQRLGYAEPDPSKDVDGDDAVEKLCVLLRHFGDFSVRRRRSNGEASATSACGPAARAAFGGALRPVAVASWCDTTVTAYAGPAFVEITNHLSRVDGVQNAVLLTTALADGLFFSGPGAGPSVTAATVLDDVVEAVRGETEQDGYCVRDCDVAPQAEAGWFVRLTSNALAENAAPALLGSLGVRLRRTSHVDARSGRHYQWLLTRPCARAHLAAALDVLEARTDCRSWFIPCVE
jgi:homoserine dehydrogenase